MKEQSKEKKLQRPEREREKTHIWLRGEVSEELGSFHLNMLMFIREAVRCCREML